MAIVSLLALLTPGSLFAAGLLWLRRDARFAWINQLAHWPLELWIIAGSGSLATLGGVADWIYHRAGGVRIGPREQRCELAALAFGGTPLFLLMATASVSPAPSRLLLPVLVVLVFTVVLICYDEFVFHSRRCKAIETAMHRVLVFGYGVAWLAWTHWCFVKR